MTIALADISNKAEEIVKLSPNDIVIDIGCNDGTLLRSYKSPQIKKIGFEPAKNLQSYATKGTTKIFNDFFSNTPFKESFPGEKAKIITAIAMFYDLDNPNSFVADIKKCLHEEGLFVIQMMYLENMMEKVAFDNICHEHLEYYSLTSLKNLL